jgi:NAD(P)-dependent dehydrogenase (short-subunit alcohol dehydrogenase family)
VVLTDLSAPDSEAVTTTLAKLGQAASYVQANVTSEDDWQAVLSAVTGRHGKLHILVNNAGIDLTGPVATTSLDGWRQIMSINVDGVFLGVRTFVPLMERSGGEVKGGASIINVSSIMGLVGMSEVSGYNASKGAVRLFTKSRSSSRKSACPFAPTRCTPVSSSPRCFRKVFSAGSTRASPKRRRIWST